MSNNRMPKKKKEVRDVQSDVVQPASQDIRVTQGNTAVLTVTLLNSINKNLIEIKELLKDG